MDYLASGFGGDLIKGYATLAKGGRLVVDVPCVLPGILAMATPFTELLITQPITCTGNDVAVQVSALNCIVEFRGHGVIYNSAKAAVMVTKGGVNCLVDSPIVVNYNTSGSVEGAIFLYECANVIVRRARTLGGNGNGIRLQNVAGALIEDHCEIHGTLGTSSEGLTVQESSDVVIRENWIDRSLQTGMLIFANNQRVSILDNLFTNCSQNGKYTQPAIGLNPNGGVLDTVEVIGNYALDNQAVHTMECFMALQGTGTILNGTAKANGQQGMILSDLIVKAKVCPTLTNWQQ